ncbi:MAG: flippase-like domain-containing protein [Deltaproteobacteria bacterium]|nr:flippase-like domain-containing protein [Deltaproteobacteria bacterium]
MKKKRTWIGILISAIFLYLAFRKSDFGLIINQVMQVDGWLLLVSLPFLFLAFWARALRWRYMLLKSDRLSMHSVFGATMIGFMSLNIFPFRIGDFIRAYVLGSREGLSTSAVFATIVVERLFDGFTLLFILFISIFLLPFPLDPEVIDWVRAFSYLGIAIYLLALAVVLLIAFRQFVIIRLAEKLFSPTPRLKAKAVQLIHSFAEGLTTIDSFRLFMIIVSYSVLVWFFAALFYWVIMFGFLFPDGANLGVRVGFPGSLFVLGIICLGIMIPAGPGFVGTFELACIMAMKALGVAGPTAESYAIVSHALQFIPITLAGIIYLYIQHFSFKVIQKGEEKSQEELEEG